MLYRRLSVFACVLILTGCGYQAPEQIREAGISSSFTSFNSSNSFNSFTSSSLSSFAPLPRTYLLDLPFSPQAPFAVWDPLHEEACEEMSLIMVISALRGTPLSTETAESELLDIIQWEERNGYAPDVTIEELQTIAQEYFGLTGSIIEDPTVSSLEILLAGGFPVIVPVAGRDLKNPYFSGEGPWYHMLVLRGYDKKNFITNDPGTKRGEEYRYRKEHLVSVIHDWTGVKENIGTGAKRALILLKSER